MFQQNPTLKYLNCPFKGYEVQTLNSDIRYDGLYSIDVVEMYGLLNTRGGLSMRPACKQTNKTV